MSNRDTTPAGVVAVCGGDPTTSDATIWATLSQIRCHPDLGGVPVEKVNRADDGLAALDSPTLFGTRRIIVIDEPCEADQIIPLAETCGDHLVLLRCRPGTPVPAHPSITQVEVPSARDRRGVRRLLQKAAQTYGIRLDQDALGLLEDRLGGDLHRCDRTIAALAQVSADGDVDAETVALVVGEGAAPSPFRLVDLIEAGDIVGSLNELSRLCGPTRWEPIRVLGLLRNRWQAAWRVSCGTAPNPGWAGRQHARMAKRLGTDRLGAGLSHLADAEAAICGRSGLEPQTVAEICISRLAWISRNASTAPTARRGHAPGRPVTTSERRSS